MHISFIVPIYNERNTIEALVDSIRENCTGHTLQIVLIDDGSTDDSMDVINTIARGHPDIEGVHFEKNKGKTVALSTGFSMAEGDVVITMDADLQDDPQEIPRFLVAIENGSDLVCGWKTLRRDPLRRRVLSRIYNGFVGIVFGLSLHDINCGFKAMRLEVARSLDLRHDYHRLIPVLAARHGYRVSEIEVKHHARRYGKSKYGLERYWRGLRDVGRLWWEIQKDR